MKSNIIICLDFFWILGMSCRTLYGKPVGHGHLLKHLAPKSGIPLGPPIVFFTLWDRIPIKLEVVQRGSHF